MDPEPDPNDPTPGMHIWGWMSPAELRWLGAQAATMESVIEIGCLHGRSAFALATACPGTVYCIDPWDDEHDASYPSFLSNCGHFINLVAVRGRSPDVLPELVAYEAPRTGMFDMVFIDGAHTYESVLADICAWLPHTRKLICGHDYCNEDAGYPGVAQAVNDVFGEVQVGPDTSIWYVDVSVGSPIQPGLPAGPRTWTDEYGRTDTYEFVWAT